MAERYTLSHEWLAGDLPCLVLSAGRPGGSTRRWSSCCMGWGAAKKRCCPPCTSSPGSAAGPSPWMSGCTASGPSAEAREARLGADYFGTTADMIEGTAQDVSRLLDHFGAASGRHPRHLAGRLHHLRRPAAEPRLEVASVAMGSPDWVGPSAPVRAGAGPPRLRPRGPAEPAGPTSADAPAPAPADAARRGGRGRVPRRRHRPGRAAAALICRRPGAAGPGTLPRPGTFLHRRHAPPQRGVGGRIPRQPVAHPHVRLRPSTASSSCLSGRQNALPVAPGRDRTTTGDPLFADLITAPAAVASLGFPHPTFSDGYVISNPGHSPPLFWHFDRLHAPHANETDERLTLITLWYQPDRRALPAAIPAQMAAKVQRARRVAAGGTRQVQRFARHL